MQKAIKFILVLTISILCVSLFMGAETNLTWRSKAMQDISGYGGWLASNAVTLYTTDTTNSPVFPCSRPVDPSDTTLFTFVLYTGYRGSDTVRTRDIAVRYGFSYDGTYYKWITLGTDSTSWVDSTTNTSSSAYTMQAPIIVGQLYKGNNIGYPPYNKIKIYGLSHNDTTGIKFDIIPQ